jgi:hypothetical protein
MSFTAPSFGGAALTATQLMALKERHVTKKKSRKKRRARKLPAKDAHLVRTLIKRLRWWAVMLDRATH